MKEPKPTRRRKNPAPAGLPESHPFPHMNPEYPVKPWIVGTKRFETVTVQQDDGSFVSVIATEQSIRSTAKTRSAAEKGAIDRYIRTFENPAEDEGEAQDIEDLRMWEERKHEPTVSLKDVLRKYGRRRHARR